MKTARHILIFMVLSVLILSPFPVFPPEDRDRDSRIDLKDAVLSVMDFVRTADGPGKLSEKAGNAFSALEISAGLKTVISPEKKTFSPSPPVFLVSFFIFFLPLFFFSYIKEKDCLFVSRTVFPERPPS